MFKPHIAICKCHNQIRLIVVKAGLCKIGNDEKKKKSKRILLEGCSGGSKNEHGVKPTNKTSKYSQHPVRFSEGRNDSSFTWRSKRSSLNGKRKRVVRNNKSIISKRRKPTGELALFKKLYEERGPYSQVAPYEYVPFDVRCFSHLLSKQSYPSLRLEPENIVIKTPQQHDMWHNQYDKLKHLPEWKWVLYTEQKLKRKYYKQNKITKI